MPVAESDEDSDFRSHLFCSFSSLWLVRLGDWWAWWCLLFSWCCWLWMLIESVEIKIWTNILRSNSPPTLSALLVEFGETSGLLTLAVELVKPWPGLESWLWPHKAELKPAEFRWFELRPFAEFSPPGLSLPSLTVLGLDSLSWRFLWVNFYKIAVIHAHNNHNHLKWCKTCSSASSQSFCSLPWWLDRTYERYHCHQPPSSSSSLSSSPSSSSVSSSVSSLSSSSSSSSSVSSSLSSLCSPLPSTPR